jgi:putative acetyltransferase
LGRRRRAGPPDLVIRDRQLADDEAIRRLNDAAFDGTYESRLIDDLRAANCAVVELVLVDGTDVIGHILMSTLDVSVGDKPVRSLGLAPMSVQPGRQRQGIGSALVREALRRARQQGWQAVIVLGHPGYYPRFGFSAALARPLASPFSGDAFMALELIPGVLQGGAGRVVYPSAFD